MDKNQKKASQLGMPFGTANARLRKSILFALLKKLNENYCFRCGEEIESEVTLSIEHKEAWLDNDVALFWSLDNIAFSHLSCNCADSRKPTKGIIEHPSQWSYRQGCRCSECRKVESERRKNQRQRGIRT